MSITRRASYLLDDSECIITVVSRKQMMEWGIHRRNQITDSSCYCRILPERPEEYWVEYRRVRHEGEWKYLLYFVKSGLVKKLFAQNKIPVHPLFISPGCFFSGGIPDIKGNPPGWGMFAREHPKFILRILVSLLSFLLLSIGIIVQLASLITPSYSRDDLHPDELRRQSTLLEAELHREQENLINESRFLERWVRNNPGTVFSELCTYPVPGAVLREFSFGGENFTATMLLIDAAGFEGFFQSPRISDVHILSCSNVFLDGESLYQVTVSGTVRSHTGEEQSFSEFPAGNLADQIDSGLTDSTLLKTVSSIPEILKQRGDELDAAARSIFSGEPLTEHRLLTQLIDDLNDHGLILQSHTFRETLEPEIFHGDLAGGFLSGGTLMEISVSGPARALISFTDFLLSQHPVPCISRYSFNSTGSNDSSLYLEVYYGIR